MHRFAERLLDEGHGSCWFRNTLYIEELHRSLLRLHEKHYEIGCFVIMANHCHVVIRPFVGIELEDEIGAIKRVTSRFINLHERISGARWTQESYDRIVRDEEHLYELFNTLEVIQQSIASQRHGVDG